MAKKRIAFSILVLSLAIFSCNIPGQGVEGLAATLAALSLTQTAEATQGVASPAATLPSDASPTPTDTPCPAIVTANLNANVRKGPGTVYDAVGNLLTGQTAPIAGQNSEHTWWYITFPSGPGGYAWIAGSTVTATCVTASVAVIAAPPTPLPASGTCKGSYVWRLIKPSDKVCVSPASKAQADADNAAAASRLATASYGPDTCAQGYVWRDAFANDHVCVTSAVRTQAANDNAAAASRVDPVDHTYGPDTCMSGYVWREANPSDHVCVTPDVRSQAASDNAAAASRLATAAYGPDTCAQGYVWRVAFTNDHACVTPAVRTQVANDNADAPNHTW